MRPKAQSDVALAKATSPLYAIFWRWHFLAAVIVIPFVLWQSVTGTLYLWSEKWMDVSYPELRFVSPTGQSIAPSEQMAAALALEGAVLPSATSVQQDHGGHAGHVAPIASRDPRPVQQIQLSNDASRSTAVMLMGADGLPYPIFVNPYDGKVLGTLTSGQWLPGITRALHGGWPAGQAGNWLLELGNCWAIVMVVTGMYLWWPRSRGLWRAMWPRLHSGPRVMVRDLHGIVAVAFSGMLLFFLISALPWTSFWGGQVLSGIQVALDQKSPAGFSPGGSSATRMMDIGASIDAAVKSARERGVSGMLTVQMSPWPGAPLFVANRVSSVADDRVLHADPATGRIEKEFRNADLPVIPRMVSVGIHVHQGDFGPVNLWLNTALAVSLTWLSVTGTISWWIRRPKGRIGVPPSGGKPWPSSVVGSVAVAGVILPIFGASVVVIAGAGWFRRHLLYRA
ncbi:PepSY domain-containing protein [Tardiphaga alba]|uniref:PepSY domain-containing protein n=1 Tax=Tardiphaga alba TaxID=340268 RepID=A0ABX8AJM3_9BRAD|nr:PepSY domain-containing protein [Tardiphaga alba]QUS42035.1 PepSY domain-containing protein [Tardiphaga alba]